MIAPKDRYPKTKKGKKLTPRQRKAMAAAFVDRLVAETREARKQEHQ